MASRLLIESDERSAREFDDQRRRYYRLTSFGHRVLEAELSRLQQLVRNAKVRKLLKGLATS